MKTTRTPSYFDLHLFAILVENKWPLFGTTLARALLQRLWQTL
jgi:hypothetical protein